MARPRDEQETTLTYDSGEKLVRIYSARPTDINKLRRAGVKPTDGTEAKGYFYKIPLDRLGWRIRPPKEDRPKRPSNLRGKTTRKGTSDDNPLG